jgi:hypothetical protein
MAIIQQVATKSPRLAAHRGNATDMGQRSGVGLLSHVCVTLPALLKRFALSYRYVVVPTVVVMAVRL